MFSVGTEDEYYGESAMSTEPSDYDLHVARLAEERELKRQVKAFGKDGKTDAPQGEEAHRARPACAHSIQKANHSI
eukprot:COSAG06_NODE_8677_length_2099_cov_1.327500_2_plen_75_part_01